MGDLQNQMSHMQKIISYKARAIHMKSMFFFAIFSKKLAPYATTGSGRPLGKKVSRNSVIISRWNIHQIEPSVHHFASQSPHFPQFGIICRY